MEQCSPNLSVEVVEVIRDGVPIAESIIDVEKSECYCRQYKYSLSFMGPVANTTKTYPLFHCQKLVGNNPEEYLKVVNFLGDIKEDLQNAQN